MYLFGEAHAANVASFLSFIDIGWPGVLFGTAWELAYRDPIKRNLGSAGNQTACKAEDVQLYNLLIFPKETAACEANQQFVMYSPRGLSWDPTLEAHPLDPTFSLNRGDGLSQNCVLAARIIEKLLARAAAESE